MSQVFAVFLLMLFFFPALLSLLFASRSPLAIFWNFSWYFFLGELGEMATQNESGKLVGLFFATIYLLRITLFWSKRPTRRFVFKRFDGGSWNQPQGNNSFDPLNSSAADSSNEAWEAQFATSQDSWSDQGQSQKKRQIPVVLDAEFERK